MGNVRLEDLFPPKPGELPAVEDVTLGDEPIGLGFPGEKFNIVCPECGAALRLRMSKHGLFYGCERYPECDATHGAHKDGSPNGTPGDKPTRKARIFAHRLFDRLWKNENGPPRMKRSQAYTWMQRTMKLSPGEAHIGQFTADQCEQLVEAVKKNFPGVMTAWDRIMLDDEPF